MFNSFYSVAVQQPSGRCIVGIPVAAQGVAEAKRKAETAFPGSKAYYAADRGPSLDAFAPLEELPFDLAPDVLAVLQEYDGVIL